MKSSLTPPSPMPSATASCTLLIALSSKESRCASSTHIERPSRRKGRNDLNPRASSLGAAFDRETAPQEGRHCILQKHLVSTNTLEKHGRWQLPTGNCRRILDDPSGSSLWTTS